MSQKVSKLDSFYKNVAPKITGVGASVVIIGALFKIQHWPTADIWLILGLGTEAVLFFMFAFQPQHDEVDWTLVYPELKGGEAKKGKEVETPAVSQKDIQAFANSLGDVVKSGTLTGLKSSFDNLNKSVSEIKEVTSVSTASKDYADKIKEASAKLNDMNASYGTAVSAMSELSNASLDAKKYHEQVQNITKNLGALNAVYEMELQDANSHLKAISKFYSNLTGVMENMAEASKDAEQFKSEMTKLTGNLSSLNNVYGSMLAAMRGN